MRNFTFLLLACDYRPVSQPSQPPPPCSCSSFAEAGAGAGAGAGAAEEDAAGVGAEAAAVAWRVAVGLAVTTASAVATSLSLFFLFFFFMEDFLACTDLDIFMRLVSLGKASVCTAKSKCSGLQGTACMAGGMGASGPASNRDRRSVAANVAFTVCTAHNIQHAHPHPHKSHTVCKHTTAQHKKGEGGQQPRSLPWQ